MMISEWSINKYDVKLYNYLKFYSSTFEMIELSINILALYLELYSNF